MTISSALFPSCGWHCQRSTWALAMSIGTRRKSFASTNGATLTMTSSDFRLSEWAVFMFLLYILCQLVPYHGMAVNVVCSLKDLHRTGCSLFCGIDAEANQLMLKRVLLGYARWNKTIGYCQGFNMLAVSAYTLNFIFFENNFCHSIEHNL